MAFKERKLEVLTWDKVGLVAKGHLTRIQTVKFKDGGSNLKYTVKTPTGTIIEFNGASTLNSKLATSDMGCNIYVEYLGEDTTREMREGASRPKLFKVMVDDEDKLTSPGITDSDIPF